MIGARKFSWGSAVLATFYKEMCGRRHQLKPKSEVAYHYYNHGLDFAFHFYVLEWTTHIHSPS
ncbi:hypothetical protein Gotri_007788 [Gossypium trilobum]|uniref:Uncharacterized protein n=1 Tax=Gossypium trilobum TaxID=34281 RepID=A0A7J9EH84_9ROSI|nr:hypothetical protein [Gossypium trilobum]